MLLINDACSSHDDPKDDRGHLKVETYPPNCTSVHQPIDMGIVAATKMIYKRKILDVKVSTMLDAPTPRA